MHSQTDAVFMGDIFSILYRSSTAKLVSIIVNYTDNYCGVKGHGPWIYILSIFMVLTLYGSETTSIRVYRTAQPGSVISYSENPLNLACAYAVHTK